MPRLTTARLERGLSLRQAAQRIGVSRETLAKAERGGRIHPAKAKLIGDYFGLTVTQVLALDGAEPNGDRAAA